jgi:hypothetical protein
MSDILIETIVPVTHDLGDFKVRRTLPAKTRTMVGPFIFVDQFGPARLAAGHGMDVRPHPHINLSTVSYLFEGAIEHRDSVGSHAVIEPGAVNLMTAGRGIRCWRHPACGRGSSWGRCGARPPLRPATRQRSMPRSRWRQGRGSPSMPVLTSARSW